ncbi:MAG: purine-nucleoside phosphorylase [Bacteroidetes bacterium]|nr:purine-nucleoside phosphorylase [Bacteroidota bacterium]
MVNIEETVKAINLKIKNFKPTVGIVLGSGLGSFAEQIDVRYKIKYKDIKDFPVSTIAGHDGSLVFGYLGEVRVVVMKGRFHYYEGYSMEQVTAPIRVMSLLGVKRVLLSNAAGSLNDDLKVGDMMIITNHINMLPNPLVGKNDDRFGTRFPDMKEPYSKRLIEKAKQVYSNLKEGVYISCSGPSYETSAEIKFYKLIGGDAVGMSTIPEVIVARHAGMEVFALSLITNSTNNDIAITHEEVLNIGIKASDRMARLFKELAMVKL